MILCKSFDSLARARALKRALRNTGANNVRIYKNGSYWIVEWSA
jgi:hypothetical protein